MSVSKGSICIFGCGNTLMGDDGIGSRVIKKLQSLSYECLENVKIEDIGICNLGLLNMIKNADKVIIIDSVITGSEKGSIIRIDGSELLKTNHDPNPAFSMHEISLSDVLLAGSYIQKLPEIVVFGIEVGENTNELSSQISSKVLEAVDRIIPLIIEEMKIEENTQIFE
ncbi:coenzyme F420-reducing hydrogenase delta subunit [Methanosalsum zhilinae DSM 4017]|uniref:Coenzyme F420-reducing hydrogenase delta subunit n=1 Tax=Methanosalsum zhilinae (strain DSM 4017 / NBRC 107636 / OCM 62 / WeN5) TaxID=679901 RepID=F7XLB8_METZD|nr:hydrogenase maturation protease [Methanosalsum zhilinae]AEH60775.1 coenzyme F420-reducing hydrogenase delta subunit [Methanosalsum zhilinae DSM 4017]